MPETHTPKRGPGRPRRTDTTITTMKVPHQFRELVRQLAAQRGCGQVDAILWYLLPILQAESPGAPGGSAPSTSTTEDDIFVDAGDLASLHDQRDREIAAGCIYRGALATCHATGCPLHDTGTDDDLFL